ncbi:hypothetical protein CHS0354_002987 [Potamilus streckersoni]|uniref:Sushi domain-containing protein n=1 Tax=Potamilus streckersoni TaxID=2493646 RepID=A0AAE0RS93_9BIVA|nr:hypothetical protein CHS0354_002987 [Potamilus streckersoni]
MYEKYIFSRNGLMCFLLMWSISICKVTCHRCPPEFYGGYMETSCSRIPEDWCKFYCRPGFVGNIGFLTCMKGGNWSPDTNSVCIKSVNQTSSDSDSRRPREGNVGTIVGIVTAVLIVMIVIVTIVVWIANRVRKSQRRVPGHASGRYVSLRENPEQNVTSRIQQPNVDGIGSVSSFESPSYNGFYVHPFVQRIPTISSSCEYPEPPPSYSETQIATNESPPTYKEVLTDPTRFNLYI